VSKETHPSATYFVGRSIAVVGAASGIGRVSASHLVSQGASIAGKQGHAGMAAYSSSKAGLIGLVKTVGKEYATTGVTINALAPAVIRTPQVDALPEAQVEYMTAKIPMRRTGRLQEAADMAAFVPSSMCSFTPGSHSI
jgi:NAD(P)-dependent dehydrogenase (short-subunit alcohol dehydrogenase family)